VRKRELAKQVEFWKHEAKLEKESRVYWMKEEALTYKRLTKKLNKKEKVVGKVTYLGEMKVRNETDDVVTYDVVADFQSDELDLVNAWATARRIENQNEKLYITKQTSVAVGKDGREARSYSDTYYGASSYAALYPRIFSNYRY